jgi:signal transduction histidine kinase
MRRSVRLRTALAAAAALIPLLGGASIAGVLLQRNELTDATALVAQEQARTLATELADSHAGEQNGAAGSLGGEESLLQVVRNDGTVVDSSTALQGQPPLVAAPPGGSPVRRTVDGVANGEPERFVALAIPVSGRDEYVIAARSMESVDQAYASTTRILLAGSILVVLVVGGLTWVMTGRALRPVEAMRSRASQITAADLSARLPEPGTGDEIARLADTMNDMLERLEKSSTAQRQFVADASHELRSPIATIRTLHETAHLGTHPDGVAGQSREVLAETARLESLVADLLLLARSDVAVPRPRKPVDLSELVSVETSRSRRLPVDVDIAAGVVADADEPALTRALRNLLDNAERHGLTSIGVTLTTADGRASVVVRDDGPGVPKADRERIFDRFVRLDDARTRDDGGSGLGLAIARQIAVDHGGTLGVADAASGAAFVLTLPTRTRGGAA